MSQKGRRKQHNRKKSQLPKSKRVKKKDGKNDIQRKKDDKKITYERQT